MNNELIALLEKQTRASHKFGSSLQIPCLFGQWSSACVKFSIDYYLKHH